MSHQPLLRSSDALKNYTVTSLQVVAYLKAYKEEKPNKENIAGIKKTTAIVPVPYQSSAFSLSHFFTGIYCVLWAFWA